MDIKELPAPEGDPFEHLRDGMELIELDGPDGKEVGRHTITSRPAKPAAVDWVDAEQIPRSPAEIAFAAKFAAMPEDERRRALRMEVDDDRA